MRAEVARGSEIGDEIDKTMNEGKWVPDAITYALLEQHMENVHNGNIILTGVVRTVEQIPMLDTMLKRRGKKLDRVVYFKLEDEEAVKRLSNRWYAKDGTIYHSIYNPPKEEGIHDADGSPLFQREDDKPDAIKERLKQFHETNKPILDTYEDRGILLTVDAAPSIEKINKVLVKELGLTKE